MEEVVEKPKKQEKKEIKTTPKKKLTIWRILAYFIIYSVIGFLIETTFAFIMYGVLESRQSFLYGPFCSIYGLGAVVMILILRYFDKNNYTLFIAGYVIGSIVEYLVSLFGELILNTSWWDYSNRFLNINGRICFTYSIFWGLLGIYLIRSINPKIDKLIDWVGNKLSPKISKTIITILMMFLLFDCIVSALAQDWVLTKVAVEKNLDVKQEENEHKKYDSIYNDPEKKEFVDKYWSVEKVLKAYPNLTTNLENGEKIYIKNLYKDIKTYYFKAER